MICWRSGRRFGRDPPARPAWWGNSPRPLQAGWAGAKSMKLGGGAALRGAANGGFFPFRSGAGATGRAEREGGLVGSLVLNRFLIERRIGSGGFGVVYEAWDGRLERPVAVKAIEQQGEAGRRVLREAQAAARLNHPGIVTLYELGEEDGTRCWSASWSRADARPSSDRRGALRPRHRRDRRRPLRGARPRPRPRRRPPRHQAAERPRPRRRAAAPS